MAVKIISKVHDSVMMSDNHVLMYLPSAFQETVGLSVVGKQLGVAFFREQTVPAGYLETKSACTQIKDFLFRNL